MMHAANIEFDSHGRSDTPVIFLHGIGGNIASFAPQIAGLCTDMRVIACNLPGYGKSARLEQMSFETLASRIIAFADAIGVKKFHLCGQSIGGMIAIETALRYSERIASLGLIATTSAFGGRDHRFRDSFIKARLAPLETGETLEQLATRFVPEIVGPIANQDAIASAIASMGAVSEQTYRDIIACLVTFDRRNDLARITVPTCLIAGEKDKQAPAKTMASMAKLLANGQIHVIADAGHLVNLEAPDQTNSILKNFIGSLS